MLLTDRGIQPWSGQSYGCSLRPTYSRAPMFPCLNCKLHSRATNELGLSVKEGWDGMGWEGILVLVLIVFLILHPYTWSTPPYSFLWDFTVSRIDLKIGWHHACARALCINQGDQRALVSILFSGSCLSIPSLWFSSDNCINLWTSLSPVTVAIWYSTTRSTKREQEHMLIAPL